ncbi:MAG TPA: hypothetical protein EYO39_09950 [Nitrospirales bacterium]|nr:hypothetical protein [Nitrospirales bacterium]
MCFFILLGLSACAEYGVGNHTRDAPAGATNEAIDILKSFQRAWAITQGAKPIREEVGSDCLVVLNVFYTTAVTADILVFRDSAVMEVSAFAKKRVAMFDTVIHGRAGESIDLPHQVRLAIQERELGMVTFQKLYIGLDAAPGGAKNPIEDKKREQPRRSFADNTERCVTILRPLRSYMPEKPQNT